MILTLGTCRQHKGKLWGLRGSSCQAGLPWAKEHPKTPSFPPAKHARLACLSAAVSDANLTALPRSLSRLVALPTFDFCKCSSLAALPECIVGCTALQALHMWRSLAALFASLASCQHVHGASVKKNH